MTKEEFIGLYDLLHEEDGEVIISKGQKQIPLIIFGPSFSDYNNLSYNKYNFVINSHDETNEINQLYSTLYLGFSQ